tara:strand:- start:739 stop:975 length:237 start_codon:yes stop_codon:yes gene_type:complete
MMDYSLGQKVNVPQFEGCECHAPFESEQEALYWKMQHIYGDNIEDDKEAIRAMLPRIRALEDDDLVEFLSDIGVRMEF